MTKKWLQSVISRWGMHLIEHMPCCQGKDTQIRMYTMEELDQGSLRPLKKCPEDKHITLVGN